MPGAVLGSVEVKSGGLRCWEEKEALEGQWRGVSGDVSSIPAWSIPADACASSSPVGLCQVREVPGAAVVSSGCALAPIPRAPGTDIKRMGHLWGISGASLAAVPALG